MEVAMDGHLQAVTQAIQERFGAEIHRYAGDTSLILAAEHNVEALTVLRDEYGFDMFIAATAVDYWPQLEPRFHVLYFIYSMKHNINIMVRVPLNGNAPHLRTMEGIYPNANWYEREMYDMFGITFTGHSDLRRILMPKDWQGHPLRKDYPLGYEEVRFTFNKEEIDRRKPLAQE